MALADQKDAAGLPIADGIIASEELGSSYSWIKGSNKPSENKHATDYPRGTSDYHYLSQALTPFTRFSFAGAAFPNTTYASINPMVMSRQNNKLFKALFNFEPSDNRLKMYFSVGFPVDPVYNPLKEDDVATKKGVIADSKFFETFCGPLMLSAMPTQTIPSTSTTQGLPFAYNARDDAGDTHTFLPDTNFLLPNRTSLVLDAKKSWRDAEFAAAPALTDAYYVAMDKAADRLARAFKGTDSYNLPAENAMCPIMTRQALEVAIIKAVFGDSILFVISDPSGSKVFFNDYGANSGVGNANKLGKIDRLRLYNAIKGDEIKLENVKFVENAFDATLDPIMANKYFVPFWNGCNIDSTCAKLVKGLPDIKVPAFGLYFDTGNYVNYLPHPQTDQRYLNNVYVSYAAAYSKEYALASTGATDYQIPKLYEVATDKVKSCLKNVGDTIDAYLDMSLFPTVTVDNNAATPAEYCKLYNYDGSAPNVNLKAADFSPYETKIRMAVLVNLLNAIIPAKINPTNNFPNAAIPKNVNDTLFTNGAIPAVAAKNLKEFIAFDSSTGEYKVNTNTGGLMASATSYLNGWQGGVKTPGMTFWKYGVHSTTFQCTVDAFKYADSARLSAVVTFDLFDEGGVALGVKPCYPLTTPSAVNSVIYLNPLGRQANSGVKDANKYVIGNGDMRYPTVVKTDSWKILSFVWSESYGRSVGLSDYFVPIYLFTGDVVNVGPDGGYWHYERSSVEPVSPAAPTFTKFYMNSASVSSLKGDIGNNTDWSTGAAKIRKSSFGANSWLKWNASVTKTMDTNTLELSMTLTPGKSDNHSHTISFIKKSTGATVGSVTIITTSNGATTPISTSTNKIDIPFVLDRGIYEIKLNENFDSGSSTENITGITILEK